MNKKLWLLSVLNIAVVAMAVACSNDKKGDENKVLSNERDGYYVSVDSLENLQFHRQEDGSCGPYLIYSPEDKGSVRLEVYKIIGDRVQYSSSVESDESLNGGEVTIGTAQLMYPGLVIENKDGLGTFIDYGYIRGNTFRYSEAYLRAIKSFGITLQSLDMELVSTNVDKMELKMNNVQYVFPNEDDNWTAEGYSTKLTKISAQDYSELYRFALSCTENQVMYEEPN